MGLSHAQAVEVAKRLDPRPGRVLWFAEDGSLISALGSLPASVRSYGRVYACRRHGPREPVEVARVTPDQLQARGEPGFGVPW
jgi:hypothetical protein